MSAREWVAGDVGITAGDPGDGPVRFLVCTYGQGLRFQYADGDAVSHPPREDARHLVVIDPEDREQVVNLLSLYCVEFGDRYEPNGRHVRATDAMQDALRELANPTSPKPDEPRGWLAAVIDTDDNRWCLHGGPVEPRLEWYSPDLNTRRSYADIAAVRVLSEGVTP